LAGDPGDFAPRATRLPAPRPVAVDVDARMWDAEVS
jgi:hypothetical protein